MNANALMGRLRGLLRGGTAYAIDPLNGVTLAAFPLANRVYWTRLIEGATISSVKANVGVQNGNLCVAYARNAGSGVNAKPGDLIGSTGSVAVPASGEASIALSAPITVKAGDWVGIACDSLTATLRATTTGGAVDTALAAGRSYRETIASGGPAIPTTRSTLTATIGRNWVLVGV